MIKVSNISKNFIGIKAIDGVSFEIDQGSIIGLIGPNGAGKTTLFNIVAGHLSPSSGAVYLDGEDITFLKPHELFRKGLLRTFQIAHEFSSLTVLENLMVVPGDQFGEQLVHTWFNCAKVRKADELVRKQAKEVINFLELNQMENELAGNLSGGQKKLLELGRTMMANPKIVFLDEIGAGVSRRLLKIIAGSILRLNQQFGYTFCLIEHDMDFIARLCDMVIVMAEGRILTQGKPNEVINNEDVIEAYLGTGRKYKKVS
ncbi:branched-chain amino acid ABC transporter, ATP-binding protein LivG-1 [Candidatus Endolissoclinum faulkneri L5]|uniref:Branched-chain amino acid ABC transporter, ATP-binding protein LivG-1 n=1 Tax=Candidatus Endolissoclinum faulkneri L5 TaxID=1401328 RepID=V9TSX8_9PROT|nr:ABC transporter ATP-binding protein [Candidatus Endolissoclinum faulkneri]AHC73671.1 branched-chain amino acid ABC transporter, ATP-binding protein LivG-1 [Candidatus Endolissoclinum faulkneri L5]